MRKKLKIIFWKILVLFCFHVGSAEGRCRCGCPDAVVVLGCCSDRRVGPATRSGGWVLGLALGPGLRSGVGLAFDRGSPSSSSECFLRQHSCCCGSLWDRLHRMKRCLRWCCPSSRVVQDELVPSWRMVELKIWSFGMISWATLLHCCRVVWTPDRSLFWRCERSETICWK